MQDHDRHSTQRPLSVGRDPAAPVRTPFWPFVLMLVIPAFLVQLVPVLNIFLIFLLSPVWIAIIVNATLVAMVIDVLRGAARRALITVPIAVYALNLAASGATYLNQQALNARLRAENAQASLPFDPVRQSLVGPDDLAESLVQTHALPVVYIARVSGERGALRSLRVLPEATCDTIPHSEDPDILVTGVEIGHVSVEGGCLLRMRVAPDRPELVITRKQTSAWLGLVHLNETRFTAADGRVARIATGRATVLFPIPVPLVACATWTDGLQCQAGFWGPQDDVGRASPRRRGETDWAAELSWAPVVLGLKARATHPVSQVGHRKMVALDGAETTRLAAGSEAEVKRARLMAVGSIERERTRP